LYRNGSKQFRQGPDAIARRAAKLHQPAVVQHRDPRRSTDRGQAVRHGDRGPPFLDPPDFHALLEAHDGVAWRIVDVTGLAPVETLVRIATGRDAAEVAWASANGDLRLDDVEVSAVVRPS